MGFFNKKPKQTAEEVFEEGLKLCEAEKYKEAHQKFVKSAEMGFARGDYAVGVDYLRGEGVETDYEKALYYFKKAFDEGYEKAAEYLGMMYFCVGEFGLDEDQEEAFPYLKLAAESGDEISMFFLSKAYLGGIGCEMCTHLAGYWAQEAIEHGAETAYETLGVLCATGLYLSECPAYARYCFERLAQAAGNDDWEGVMPDYIDDFYDAIREASPVKPPRFSYVDAVEDFFKEENILMNCYVRGLEFVNGEDEDGNEVPVDAKEGERLLTIAADYGYGKAMTSLASRYLNTGKGYGVRYDEDGSVYAFGADTPKALKYYSLAARQGSEYALEALSMLYTYGDRDIEPNKEKAKEYWQLRYQLYGAEYIKEDILDDFDNYFQMMMSSFAREEAGKKYVGLGCSALLDGKKKEAKRNFQKAVNFKSGEGAYRLAKLWKDEGEMDSARLYMQKAIEWEYPGAKEAYQEL